MPRDVQGSDGLFQESKTTGTSDISVAGDFILAPIATRIRSRADSNLAKAPQAVTVAFTTTGMTPDGG